MTAEGESAGLEMTEARPEGAFTAALRDIEAKLLGRVSNDPALARIIARRRISIGFIALPPSRQIPELVESIVDWVKAHDWDAGDPPAPTQGVLGEHVTAAIGFSGSDPERPIRAAWHTTARPIPNGVELIAGAIAAKKRKRYDTAPLWLGVNANLVFDAMPSVKRSRIDPGQFDRLYISDGQDAVIVKRVRV